MKLNRQQIHERAMQVLEANPQGIRWSDLLRTIEANAPDTPHNSIHGGIHNLLTTRTSEIAKVARGTYQLSKFVDADDAIANAQEVATVITPVKHSPNRTSMPALRSGWKKMTRPPLRPRWVGAASVANGEPPMLSASSSHGRRIFSNSSRKS